MTDKKKIAAFREVPKQDIQDFLIKVVNSAAATATHTAKEMWLTQCKAWRRQNLFVPMDEKLSSVAKMPGPLLGPLPLITLVTGAIRECSKVHNVDMHDEGDSQEQVPKENTNDDTQEKHDEAAESSALEQEQDEVQLMMMSNNDSVAISMPKTAVVKTTPRPSPPTTVSKSHKQVRGKDFVVVMHRPLAEACSPQHKDGDEDLAMAEKEDAEIESARSTPLNTSKRAHLDDVEEDSSCGKDSMSDVTLSHQMQQDTCTKSPHKRGRETLTGGRRHARR